jgi:hypothetical protein
MKPESSAVERRITEPAAAPVTQPAPQRPPGGGRFERLPDGSLKQIQGPAPLGKE